MCIALLTTAHPHYKLILIDNRDEYINRPTARAGWWPKHPSVLGGRDLHRSIQGTWLGVTKTGKIAVLTNFRENTPPPPNAVSRGEIIKKFLTEDVGDTEEFVRDVVEQGVAREAGGFSLVCGRVGESLAVVSNRARKGEEVPWICGDVVQTVGLSNGPFGDRGWEKVVDGEVGVLDAVRVNFRDGGSQDDLVEGLMAVLSDDALSRQGFDVEEGLVKHVLELRKTILVPPLGKADEDDNLPADEIAAAKSAEGVEIVDGEENATKSKQLGVSGIYATHKQTVVLIDQNDNVRFVERTLFDEKGNPIDKKDGTVDFRFKIEQDAE